MTFIVGDGTNVLLDFLQSFATAGLSAVLAALGTAFFLNRFALRMEEWRADREILRELHILADQIAFAVTIFEQLDRIRDSFIKIQESKMQLDHLWNSFNNIKRKAMTLGTLDIIEFARAFLTVKRQVDDYAKPENQGKLNDKHTRAKARDLVLALHGSLQ